MHDSEETRLALDQVDELAGEEMHAQAKKGAKRTLKVILIAAAVILLLSAPPRSCCVWQVMISRAPAGSLP
ncbi:MAG: hypothetical protein IJL47_07735 [Lachnospiraceae bacterium]|nr:hypothetical protein [Lachnospiraceae bacterium]